MILSILIPTLNKRAHLLNKLLDELNKQINEENAVGKVEILVNADNGQKTTGQKRNDLKDNAKGDYIIYLDDDDEPDHYYIKEILNGATFNPDCIVFNGYMTTNGSNRVNFVIRLGEKYEERRGVYYRYPNHICAIKRELVKNINFPNKKIGEDYEWATNIKNSGILKTQYIINKDLYHYKFLTRK